MKLAVSQNTEQDQPVVNQPVQPINTTVSKISIKEIRPAVSTSTGVSTNPEVQPSNSTPRSNSNFENSLRQK